MLASLTAQRVRSDVEVLSRAGLGLDEFVEEATTAVRRAVPWVAACVGTHDPASLMLTGARKFGSLDAHHQHDNLWSVLEYGHGEPTSFRGLAGADIQAVAMHELPDRAVERSPRMNELMRPIYGFDDEARMVFRDSGGLWGCMAMFRAPGERKFNADDVAFLETLSESFARGVRAGILTRLSAPTAADLQSFGPAVVIVDADHQVAQISRGASDRLALLATSSRDGDPLSLVMGVAAAARRAGADRDAPLPRARVRTPSGQWLVLHGAPMDGRDGATGQVVVTIEEARPPEIVALVVTAFGLTPRERDVTRLVLQGADTKEIATALHVSTYTVQDHLKAVFGKAGVRSRRELIARIYFDQYIPRMGAEVGPTGWFLDDGEMA